MKKTQSRKEAVSAQSMALFQWIFKSPTSASKSCFKKIASTSGHSTKLLLDWQHPKSWEYKGTTPQCQRPLRDILLKFSVIDTQNMHMCKGDTFSKPSILGMYSSNFGCVHYFTLLYEYISLLFPLAQLVGGPNPLQSVTNHHTKRDDHALPEANLL